MDKDMLEQIQQMITTATDSLRQDFRQDMAAMESRLGGRIERMAFDFGERIEGVGQSQGSMEFRLGERIEEVVQSQQSMESRLGERIEGVVQSQQSMESRLGERIEGIVRAQRSMEFRLGERIEGVEERVGGVEQAQRTMESRLGERIEESKRHSGVLVEGLRHELQLVAEGLQMHVDQRHAEERVYLDHKFQEMQVLIHTRIDTLDQRVPTLEQR